jgi:uncharacterized protein (DUF697 family)
MTDIAQDAAANGIITKYAAIAVGAGLIPIAGLDVVAIAGVELKMLADLSAVYGVPFSHDRVKPIVASIIGGYASKRLGMGIGAGALKAVPVVGVLLGSVAVPTMAAGLTYAIGRVFMQHFASGGTFLDFDPATVRNHYSPATAAPDVVVVPA